MKSSLSMWTMAGAAAAFGLGATAGAAEEIKLTVVAPAPAPVTYVKMFKDKAIPEIDRRLAEAGKGLTIRWVQAYGQSLAKAYETFEAVEENIAQVGLLVKNFEEAKLPLEQYPVMAPFTNETSEQIVAIDASIRKRVPAMNEAYLKHNQEFLVSGVSPQYDLFTTFPVKTLDDLKGRKIGVSGVLGQWFRGLDTTVVTSAMVESFTSIRSGIYDGYPISINLAFPFKTYEAAKYYTKVELGVSTSPALSVNLDTWKKLPGYAQEIFRETAAKWPVWQIEEDEQRRNRFIGLMKKKGVEFAELPQSERVRWAKSMPNIAQEWAARQEEKGLPGKAVLAAYMDELRGHKVQILREWDKE